LPGAGSNRAAPGPADHDRPRLLLGLILFAAVGLLTLARPVPPAGAAGLTPCSTSPTGPIVTLDGEATLETGKSGRKMLRQAGVSRGLIRPANANTGRPTFPIRKVRYGATSRIWLRGGLTFKRKKRRTAARKLVAFIPKNRRKPARVTARLGGRKVVLFRLSGGHLVMRKARGELDLLNAKSRLGGKAVKLLNRRLGLMRVKKRKRLTARVRLDRFDLSATYFKVKPDDPVAETPVEPPLAVKPEGTAQVTTASINWELRDSWINYVNTGETPLPGGGVEPGTPRGSAGLVYDYTFPFGSGWTVPGDGTGGASLIRGTGSLAFRYCEHTVNFKASDPEIELSDDESSRMIFRVDGTDGTAFPDQRAVMVKLRPSKATAHTVTESDGTATVTWERIPGYIPAEGTGIFADFYPAYDPARWGSMPQKDRPDRFGYLTVSYTYPVPGP